MWFACDQNVTLVLLTLAEQMEEIADSLCVGQQYQGDERVVLFLKIAAGYRYYKITWAHVVVMWPWYSRSPVSFSNELVKKVKSEIRSQLSARHVPSIVLETKDIPVSVFNWKLEEVWCVSGECVGVYLYVNSCWSLTEDLSGPAMTKGSPQAGMCYTAAIHLLHYFKKKTLPFPSLPLSLPLLLYSHFPSFLSFQSFFSQYTINSKKVEVAVKRIISGEDVQQRGALANPQSLNLYYNIPELDIRTAGQ